MVVLYLRNLGQPLGALTTTVPSDLPEIGDIATLPVAVLLPSTSGPSLVPITVARNDLAIARLDAEFDNPLDVFGWRVITSQGVDGKEQRRLDRLGTGSVTVTGSKFGPSLQITVPKLGNESQLNFEVRNGAGVKQDGVINFPTNNAETVPVSVPQTPNSQYVVLVQGYRPATP
jgi:hypothetical protein